MDRFVKAFIFMSIVYLMTSSLIGVAMLSNSRYLPLKFVHSHLMLLGWVSMMIYGVGYHILPRFAGRVLKSRAVAVLQFWTANVGLLGMLGFYLAAYYEPQSAGTYRTLSAAFGGLEVFSIALFVYNMIATIYTKAPE